MNKVALIVVGLLPLSAFSSEQCEMNFTKDGSFFSGKTYRTWADVKGVSYSDAYRRVYQIITKEGSTIVSSDKDLGVISAARNVSYGKGQAAPLNVVIEEQSSGVKISMSFKMSGGVVAPSSAVMKSFCNTIASANPKS